MTDAVDGIETHSIFRTLGNHWEIDRYVPFADLSFFSKKMFAADFVLAIGTLCLIPFVC